MKKKTINVVKKRKEKNHNKLLIERKFKKFNQKMHATRIQNNKKSKRFQPYKRSLYKDVILNSYITDFELE